LTWVLLVAGAVGSVATVGLFVHMFAGDVSGLAWSTPFLGAYAAGVIAFRLRPEHLAARRLLAFGAVATLFIAAAVGLSLAFDDTGGGWWLGPANVAVQWLGLAEGAAMIALLAVYPDGRYGHRYEPRLVGLVAGLAVAVPIVLLLTRPTLQPAWVFAWGTQNGAGSAAAGFPQITSPIHIGALAFFGAPARAYLDAALALAPLAGAIVIGLRYRRRDAAQRLQIRWPLYGVLAVLVAPVATVLEESGVLYPALSQPLVIAGLVALPAAVLVGLVRPDLFDVDRAMRRSLVYTPLWIAIGGAYLGIAAAVGLAASSAGLQLAIAVTIVVTVLFEPARRRLAGRAARWAYGESVSGEELVRRLGATLEHTLDLEQLTAAIAANACEGLGVAWTRIWVDGAEPVIDGAPPGADEPPVLSAALVHAGERLGQIDCGPRVRGRARRADDEALLDTLAPQAALAINNARLASQLGLKLNEIKGQAGELAASRSRIVAAQESARRQIERDIHDGAQQELVALIARIGLAQNQFGRGSGRLGETLGDLQSEARQALENLRRFASGIHPSVLSDHGLVEAIEIRSARLPLGVTIECDPQMRTTRFSDEIESAAYFFVSEGLANTLKHASAERARVRIVRSEDELAVEVADDGAGFEVDAVRLGGLRGLSDRIGAVGGTIAVDSSPGHGTRLTARLPVGDRAVV
jgi:signal transduction histidine kinase